MKRIVWWIILCLTVTVFSRALAEADSIPRIILYTCYQQAGWGDQVQVGCVDENGGLWLLTGNDSDLEWPYKRDEQLAYLQTCAALDQTGELRSGVLFDLKGLIASVEDQGSHSHPVAEDAGTECSYAVQYDRDGAVSCVLLGMSGDSCFENFDPNAQALYQRLRQLFPQVRSFGGNMGPAGFLPVPVRAFCGWDDVDFSDVTISGAYQDCEAGSVAISLTEEDQRALLDIVLNGKVTGKAKASLTTGGTTCYSFYDQEDHFLASIELYEGLLVRPDGMYTISEN